MLFAPLQLIRIASWVTFFNKSLQHIKYHQGKQHLREFTVLFVNSSFQRKKGMFPYYMLIMVRRFSVV